MQTCRFREKKRYLGKVKEVQKPALKLNSRANVDFPVLRSLSRSNCAFTSPRD